MDLQKAVEQDDVLVKVAGQRLINNQDALILKTSYGYKIVKLAPDVKKVYIEATTLCNFDCTTCIRNSWKDKLGHMDMAIFDRVMESLTALPNLECIHFGGFGEPLSHPHIMSMLKRVKELNVRVEMISNGSLLDEKVINGLLDLGLDKLFISLDGPDEADYNDIRKGGDFSSVISNIKLLNTIKAQRKTLIPELGVEFVAMKKNFNKLPVLVSMLDELQVRQLLVTNMLPYCEELKEEIMYDLDDTVRLFGNDSLFLSVRAKMPHMKLRTQRYCKFNDDKALTITRDGNVAPCYALMHSYTCYIYGRTKQINPYHLGNVAEMGLKEIWMKPEYARFRANLNEFSFPSCTDCKCLEGCDLPNSNEMDCWANSPSCSDCLWSRGLIVCP